MSVDRADAVISREKWGHDFLVMDNESITMLIVLWPAGSFSHRVFDAPATEHS